MRPRQGSIHTTLSQVLVLRRGQARTLWGARGGSVPVLAPILMTEL